MKKKFNKISLDECKYYFDFDTSGKLWWKVSRQGIKKGDLAGNFNNRGYFIVKFEGNCYLVHRILYQLYHDVELDNVMIDHQDQNKQNNSIENLRLDSNNQNIQNRKVLKNNKSTGIKNINKRKKGNYEYYYLKIMKNNKQVYSKCYRVDKFTIEDVIKIRDEKLLDYHGEFASFG